MPWRRRRRRRRRRRGRGRVSSFSSPFERDALRLVVALSFVRSLLVFLLLFVIDLILILRVHLLSSRVFHFDFVSSFRSSLPFASSHTKKKAQSRTRKTSTSRHHLDREERELREREREREKEREREREKGV